MKRNLALILILVLCISSFAACDKKEEVEDPPKEIQLKSIDFIGKDYYDVREQFEELGFTNIDVEEVDGLTSAEEEKDDTVQRVTIDGDETYEDGAKYMSNVEIVIYYDNIKTVYAPFSSDERPEDELYGGIKKLFKDEGFTNIKVKPIEDLIFGWLTEDGEVETVTIDGDDTFDEFTSYNFDTEVVIKYHTFPQDDEEDEESKSEDTTNDNSSELVQSSPVFYSTNDYETAKNGNTGVFAYKKINTDFDVYWIVDFDEGYAYNFFHGDGSSDCSKYKISSGDLNDRITLNIDDAGYKITWYLHFKYKNAPETLVLNEHLGLGPIEFSTTSLKSALSIRDTKTIYAY